jgi:CheY-like chemotaxis protein
MTDGIKPQILIMDDEPSVRECLEMYLVSAGYDVALAENGASAVAQLNRAVPQVIVTDLNMPQMSGVQLISHVRSRYPSIPVVAISGDYQGDAIPAAFIADRFYPERRTPAQFVDNDHELTCKQSFRRDWAQPTSVGTGFLERRKLCLELY